ncbi:MAG: hypothetical protein SOZ99_08310, partial [Paraeggerthella sp.]|nr:hypothetical protein [Paraeggerthella sp.]
GHFRAVILQCLNFCFHVTILHHSYVAYAAFGVLALAPSTGRSSIETAYRAHRDGIIAYMEPLRKSA